MIQWKPVVGYEGYYEVSENGDIRRVYPEHRVHSGKWVYIGDNLKSSLESNGYIK